MDKAVIAKTVADELAAATGCMIATLNSLAGPYGKAYGRCVSDLYYACFHLSSALLASHGIEARSHEAVQKLLALHFVKPAVLPQGTTARLNELMDKRHVADLHSDRPGRYCCPATVDLELRAQRPQTAGEACAGGRGRVPAALGTAVRSGADRVGKRAKASTPRGMITKCRPWTT